LGPAWVSTSARGCSPSTTAWQQQRSTWGCQQRHWRRRWRLIMLRRQQGGMPLESRCSLPPLTPRQRFMWQQSRLWCTTPWWVPGCCGFAHVMRLPLMLATEC
jgi:hypothetical protein